MIPQACLLLVFYENYLPCSKLRMKTKMKIIIIMIFRLISCAEVPRITRVSGSLQPRRQDAKAGVSRASERRGNDVASVGHAQLQVEVPEHSPGGQQLPAFLLSTTTYIAARFTH